MEGQGNFSLDYSFDKNIKKTRESIGNKQIQNFEKRIMYSKFIPADLYV